MKKKTHQLERRCDNCKYINVLLSDEPCVSCSPYPFLSKWEPDIENAILSHNLTVNRKVLDKEIEVSAFDIKKQFDTVKEATEYASEILLNGGRITSICWVFKGEMEKDK